jgi:predicted DNA-binding WGR domain protein
MKSYSGVMRRFYTVDEWYGVKGVGMRRFYAVDERGNEVILHWEGPGYYASGHWEETTFVIKRVGIDPNKYQQACEEARYHFLSNPLWADSPEEILRGCEVIIIDEISQINDEKYSEIVVEHLRKSFKCFEA